MISFLPPEDPQALLSAERLYLEAFPPEERRPWSQIVHPVSEKGPVLRLIDCDGLFAGLVTTWTFDDFVYIEHLAVASKMRGKGIGAGVIEALKAVSNRPLILEVEPVSDADPMTSRRIGFYVRNGFTLLDFDYIQPPYTGDMPPVNLHLMSTDAATDAGAATRILHREVYGCLD